MVCHTKARDTFKLQHACHKARACGTLMSQWVALTSQLECYKKRAPSCCKGNAMKRHMSQLPIATGLLQNNRHHHVTMGMPQNNAYRTFLSNGSVKEQPAASRRDGNIAKWCRSCLPIVKRVFRNNGTFMLWWECYGTILVTLSHHDRNVAERHLHIAMGMLWNDTFTSQWESHKTTTPSCHNGNVVKQHAPSHRNESAL